MFNPIRRKSIWQLLLHIFRKNSHEADKVEKNSDALNLIEYTVAFARTKRKKWKSPIDYNAHQYPRFNNVDYDPEKLMYVYNTAVAVRKSLAGLEDFTEMKEIRNRINEINGNIYNMIAALGKEKRRCEETNSEDTANTAQHGED